ncbi:3-oxoacyl-ACP reductase FabG [Aquimarina intermedia]|uniref:3-oxoacyl-[acyl-carrier protein] reductase n=1 Tax=Aquimarina intermedia TaxID=350814 RepID=A0A5S5C520_9FLAO|nr:3-oxoacyl-ACP reductase FabG [Aquimarina intermedia]TYP74229.1 3-oxoacyl-[acyl-carrier protein] reductase [Aquimarina intermedia]
MKYALVTGGSRGIGREIALKLAIDLEYPIVLNYQSNDAAANNTKAAIEDAGGTCDLLKFDVSDQQAVHTAIDTWMSEHPDALIEVLINNAGITRDGLFMWMKPEDWHQVVDISLNGFYNVTNHLIQKMLSNRYGRIINVVSVSGVKGTPGQTNYSAAKGALVGATKALAQEVAKRKITVNAVAPGFIKTDMTAEMDEKDLKRMIPANRFGEAEEVADLVSFLASKKASYITGEIVNINGGIYS